MPTDSTPATKADIADLKSHIDQKTEETKQHFDIVAENHHNDIVGAFDDRTAQYEDKLAALKRRVRRIERELAFV